MAWAAVEDVFAVTGREASPENVLAAQGIVELFAGTIIDDITDTGIVSTTNARYLTRAVCYQAVWMDDHPDVFSAMDVKGISQDGVSAQYIHENAHLVAPLAWRCIKRLSWKRAPLRVGRSRRAIIDQGNRDSAVRDDQFSWSPLPFGSSGPLGTGHHGQVMT
jgi:hypothetical protein